MADNIEQLVDIDSKEKEISPEIVESNEKLNKQIFDLSNLISIINTAGENATKLLIERLFKKN